MHCSTAVGATTAILPAPPHHHHPAQNSNNYFQLCCRTMINDWQFEPFVRFLVFTQTMFNYAGALAFKHPACTANLLISCDTLFCCTLFALHNACSPHCQLNSKYAKTDLTRKFLKISSSRI